MARRRSSRWASPDTRASTLAMMIAMPFLMAMIRVPRWFPVVPLFAHIAMVVPIGAVALAALTTGQTAASLLGALL